MRWLLASLAVLLSLVGCRSAPTHTNVVVKTLHGWESGRAKSCLLFNGGSGVEGRKPGPDPKEMQCLGPLETTPRAGMGWIVYVAKVEVDDKSEQVFHDTSRHWAVPMLCTQVAVREFSCVYDDSHRSGIP